MPLQKQVPVFYSLSPEEVSNPKLVLAELFDFADMDDARQLLWQWLKVTVTGTFHKELSSSEKAAIIDFYEKLEKLIEAAYLMQTKRQKPPAKKPIANR